MKLKYKHALIAILRGIDSQEVLTHAKVLLDAGFEYIEVPTNSPNWVESVTILQEALGDKVYIGAGTVITDANLNALLETKAPLFVSPNCNVDLLEKAIASGLKTCVGACTPTEIITAVQNGAEMVKIFPAGALGLDYCKAILAIAPKSCPYIAVGGVNIVNFRNYLNIGFGGIGFGSDLYKPGQTPEDTSEKAERIINLYNRFINEDN
jgi:2-dehydro-3-deoxyphosphogalactonate aldolase